MARWFVAAAAILAAAMAVGVWLGDRAGPEGAPDRGVPVVVGTEQLDALPASPEALLLPGRRDSLRFAVLGDVGRGDALQHETAAELTRWREAFAFDFVLLLGDNNYGAGTPEEYARRFEQPYRALLDAGVTFHAALGNHDPPGQPDYPPFHMGGHRYYRFTRSVGAPLSLAPRTADFFALDTVALDNAQLDWLAGALGASDADWKIAFYHHPLYTSGRYRATAARTRRLLEPLFVAGGLDVGLNGHEHVYERLEPQLGIQYFTSGAGATVRVGDVAATSRTAAEFDDDTHFLLMEIAGDTLHFQAVSRLGRTVDAGEMRQRVPSPASRR